ncbi:MAG: beta-propeller fold lactonase family protein [Ahniella sp.]|nr:beta-propeller fold lactonase family protein [Ahniella sp.]
MNIDGIREYFIRFGTARSGSNAFWFMLLLVLGLLSGPQVASGAAMAFIPIGAYNQVVAIDLSNNQILGYINVGINPVAIAVSQSTPRAYVSNWGNNTVSVIDTDTRAVIGTITVQNNPRGIAVSPDGGTVLVANLSSNSVSEIDATTNTIRRTISMADSPADVVFDPWGTRAYVARLGAARVGVLDTATGAVLADNFACQYPNALAIHPNGSRLYVTCPDTGTVAAMDTATNLVVQNFALANRPQGVAVSPDGSRLFVTRAELASLTTINLSNGQVVGTVSVASGSPSRTWSVGISPDGTRAYTTDFSGPHVSVVNTVNQSLVTQVMVGVTWLRNEVQSVGQFIGGRGILGAPAIGLATAGDASVMVRFAPPVFRGSLPILGYSATCGSQSASGTSSPIVVSGLPNGVPVTCRVVATNALGTSPQSAPSNEVTPNVVVVPMPPPPPQILSVTPIASQTARVEFTPLPPGGTNPVLEYEARCNPGSFSFRASTSPITVIGLWNGAVHQCAVRARNAIGWGQDSASLPVTTFTVPAIAPLISATGGVGQITLTFGTPSSDGGSPIIEYIGRRRGVEVAGPGSPLVVGGLVNGQTYACTVVARNAAGQSQISNAISAFVGLAPGAPILNSASSGPAQATLAFSAPASDGGLPILEYEGRCGNTVVTSPNAPIVIGGLVNGTTVTCSVRARNIVGFGPASNPIDVTPQDVPGKPSIVEALTANQELYLRVSVPASNGSPILHYIGRCLSGETAMSSGNTPIVRFFGVTNGQSYTCSVEAVNAIGSSTPSDPVTLVPAGPPGPPTLMTLKPGLASLTFEFEPPTFTNGGPITGYEFACRRNDQIISTTVMGQQSPFTYTGLLIGVPHECWIHAKNSGGSSAWSNRITATPAEPPGPPILNAITPLDGAARLVFDPPVFVGWSPVLEYRAECTPGSFVVTGASSPIEVSGLTNNQVYRCQVSARNVAGWSTPSNERGVIPGVFGSVADLVITKTNSATFVNGADLVDYTIVVSNPGPAAVVDARVQDPLNADFSSGVWQCVALGQAVCATDGVGGIDTRVDLPIGSSVTFTFSVLPVQGPELPISNQASVTPPVGINDPNLMNNVASDGPDILGIFRNGFE